jgi:hypothetical protein
MLADLWAQLEFSSWGMGVTHMRQWNTKPCPRCHRTGLVGDPAFPVCCPECQGQRVVPV